MSQLNRFKSPMLFALVSLLSSASAYAYGGYVAIIFDRQNGTNYGAYHGSYSQQDALFNARRYVGRPIPPGYEGQTWAHNGWVALAASHNGHTGTATGDFSHSSESAAEWDAIRNCQLNGGAGCYIVRSEASFDYQPDQQGIKRN